MTTGSGSWKPPPRWVVTRWVPPCTARVRLAPARLVGYVTSIHASFGNTHLKTTHPEVFLTSCQGILFRQHACLSSMLTEKSSTTFSVLLSWHPKQINNCAKTCSVWANRRYRSFVYGSFPKQEDPNIDLNILFSLLVGTPHIHMSYSLNS